MQKFPHTFFMFERRPLKLGIHHDITALLLALSAKEIRIAMFCYTANRFYNKACVEGAARVDLDGNEVGTVTADEAENSKLRIAGMKAARKRKAAAEKAAVAAAEIEAARPVPKGVNAVRPTRHLKGMTT